MRVTELFARRATLGRSVRLLSEFRYEQPDPDRFYTALATDTAANWEARLKPLGIPVAAVRTLREALDALPEVVVAAGEYRLVGSSIRVDGYTPDYRPPPALGQG